MTSTKAAATIAPEVVERLATPIHEAAHALVARVLGVNTGVTRIRRIELLAAGDPSGHAGQCEFGLRADGNGHTPLSAIWAGPLAEEKLRRGASFSRAHVRAALADHVDDRATIQARDFELDGGLTLDEAVIAVETLWPNIVELAVVIERNRFADDTDVRAALSLPETGDVTRELHQLRRLIQDLPG